MARTFVAASSQKLEVASAAVTTFPLTLACWVNLTTLGTGRGVMAISDGTANNRFALSLGGTNAVNANSVVGGTGSVAASSTTIGTAGTWAHLTAVYASATSRAAYLNGGGKGTNATSSTPTGLSLTAIGHNGGSAAFMNGQIAIPAVWNVALNDAEVAYLAAGNAPNLVHPEALVSFWRLIGAAPEPDSVSSLSLTVTGATYSADPANIFFGKSDNTSKLTNRAQPISTLRGGYFRIEVGNGGLWLTYGTATDLDDAETTAQSVSAAMGKPVRIIPVRSSGMDAAELSVYTRSQG